MCDLNFLQLRWARFFTLARWKWTLAPFGRSGDFYVTIPCGHSECNGSHTLNVRIYEKQREVLERLHGEMFSADAIYSEPHPALFGDGPRNTTWQMAHGAGGGLCRVDQWLGEAEELWELSANG